MNNYDYKKIHPFKWFVLQNFPFIEADFDAITEYQLLCKVVEYLNNTINSVNNIGQEVEELSTGFINLKNYVDNYFDNLDVQDEINNKLDEMVVSGSLQILLNQQYDSLRNEVNTQINTFKNQVNTEIEDISQLVNSSVNGSPIPVSSSTEMTDTTKIYVNTNDGYWYFYNGTSWESGGTYQAVRVGENEIKYLNLENGLKENIVPLNAEMGQLTNIGAVYTRVNGKATFTQAGDTWKSGVMLINENDTLLLHKFNDVAYNSYVYAFITDNNDNILESFQYINLSNYKIYKVPTGARKIYFNVPASLQNQVNPLKFNKFAYTDNRLNYSTEETALAPAEIKVNKVYSKTVWDYDLNNFNSYVFNVTPNSNIRLDVDRIAVNSYYAGIFVTDDFTFISTIGQYDDTVNFNETIKVPALATKLICSVRNNTTPHVYNKKLNLISEQTNNKKLNVSYNNGILTINNNDNGNQIVFKNHGGNNLFMISSIKIGNTVKNITTDMTPAPYIVNAVNNANGDRATEGFTGGNHQWNNSGSGSTPTARQTSLSILCDGQTLLNNSSTSCDKIVITEVNNVQANNTCLEIGGGREVLTEKITFSFDGYSLKVKNEITPLENIIIKRYYGIQLAGFNDNDYKIYSDKIYTSTGSVHQKPDEIIANNILSSKMKNIGLGSYQYNNSGSKVFISSGKSYYVPINNNETVFSPTDINYFEGSYNLL